MIVGKMQTSLQSCLRIGEQRRQWGETAYWWLRFSSHSEEAVRAGVSATPLSRFFRAYRLHGSVVVHWLGERVVYARPMSSIHPFGADSVVGALAWLGVLWLAETKDASESMPPVCLHIARKFCNSVGTGVGCLGCPMIVGGEVAERLPAWQKKNNIVTATVKTLGDVQLARQKRTIETST